jgi:hypothetical protein
MSMRYPEGAKPEKQLKQCRDSMSDAVSKPPAARRKPKASAEAST